MAEQQQPVFEIHRVYTRDVSFESPKSPEIFKGNHQYAVDVSLDTKIKALEGDFQQVSLTVHITAKLKDSEDVAYIAEVTEAGLFTVKDFPEDQRGHILNSACPNILFPYAREMISSLVNKGGFPALYLSPINFDALYAQQLAEKQQATAADSDDGGAVH